MKMIAESFMNTDKMRTKTSLEKDINESKSYDKEEENITEIDKAEEDMESDLLNFLMNGDPALSKQTEIDESEEKNVPVSGEHNIINHTNIINDKISKNDERYQLNSGKFANLNTFDSITVDGFDQFSTPM